MSLTRPQREELFLLWKKWDKANKGPLFPLDATANSGALPAYLHKSYRQLWFSFDGLSQELGERLKKGWSKTPRDWRRILLLTASEWLWGDGHQNHAILSEWGEICRQHCGEIALKVCNGTLRGLLRDHEAKSELTILKFLPTELLTHWERSGKAEGALVEVLMASRQQFYFPIDDLDSESLEQLGPMLNEQSDGYVLKRGVEPKALIDKENGFFQNIHASDVVKKLIECKSSGAVLDLCAAPGGKSWQLARLLGASEKVFMHEVNPKRAKRILKNPMLEKLNCHWVDAEKLEDMTFENVLIDVPCGNSGVLLKSPEAIKHMWYPNDLCGDVQNEILHKALNHLKDKGRLFYSTCSISPVENHYRIEKFCREMSMELIEEKQWWPDEKGGHGAYLACMQW